MSGPGLFPEGPRRLICVAWTLAGWLLHTLGGIQRNRV